MLAILPVDIVLGLLCSPIYLTVLRCSWGVNPALWFTVFHSHAHLDRVPI